MINWTDRKYINPRKRVLKNMETDEIINVEIQDDLTNIETESETPLNAEMLNLAQQELKQDTLDEVDEKISNLETLPTGGTTGQVLSKASDTNGDAEWSDIEANEIYIGQASNAPESAKLIIEDEEIEEQENFIIPKNAGAHNSIYRGKNITSLFYDGTLSQQIAAGTFDDIFIGDYIIGQTSGRKYLVADINYRLHAGDTECTTPHILMIPEKVMGTAKMNDTNTTAGAYTGSKMYTEYLTPFKTTIESDFGTSHILTSNTYFANDTTDGYESGGNWYNSPIQLMNELMVYGSNIYHNIKNGTNTPANFTTDTSQLSLFRLRRDLIIALNDSEQRKSWWLRDISSELEFAVVYLNGSPATLTATQVEGVRPAFLIY